MYTYELKDYISGNFPFSIKNTAVVADCPVHIHDYLELVIVSGGSGIHFTENEEYPIKTGDVFVAPEKDGHGYKNSKNLYVINIMFDFDKLIFPQHDLLQMPGFHTLFNLEPSLRKYHGFKSKLTLSANDLLFARELSMKIYRELEDRRPGYKTISTGFLLELLTFLSRYTPRNPSFEFQQVHLLGKAVSFLESNFTSSSITLDKLSDMVNMSKRNFQRYFKKAMGTSPINYLLTLRVNKAKELLKIFPDASISEIATHTGFYDSNYFSRQFKSITGLSPRQYREKYAVR